MERLDRPSTGSRNTSHRLSEFRQTLPKETRKNKLSIDRAIDYGQQQQVRLLINRDMLEVYVNDNLTLMVRTRSTGRIGFVTTGEFKEVQLWRNAESVERLKLK